MKRGALSKAEHFYIDQNKDKMSAQEIADDLNRSPNSIRRYMEETSNPTANPLPPPITPKTQPQMAYKAMARRTQDGNETPGITISTQAASESADEWKKIGRGSSRYRDCISKVHEDRPMEKG